jgi:hypothetical protein
VPEHDLAVVALDVVEPGMMNSAITPATKPMMMVSDKADKLLLRVGDLPISAWQRS